eukprot:5063793-Pleurochrysis_carterae.AAC.3
MLAKLEECGLIKNLGEAVGNLVARADEVRLGRTVELALGREGSAPSACRAQSSSMRQRAARLFNSCRICHEQHGGAAVELGFDGVEEMAENVAEEGTGGNFEESGAPIGRAVDKDAEVRDVGVVCLPRSVEVEVKAEVTSGALCKLVVVDMRRANVAENVEVWHGDGLAAEHEGHAFCEVEVVE